MNLIGNSLKYTQQGHIYVSLQFRDHRKTGCSVAELKIMDTGQGISEEYLKHRLYTPFAQENNLSVGAGLGLSLVQQMVSTLQGEIKVHSEVGTGTEIVVRVPLTATNPSPEDQTPLEQDQYLQDMVKDKSFSFSGFDERPSIYEQPTGIAHPHSTALLKMKESVYATMIDWYGMRPGSVTADVCVVEELHLQCNLSTFDHGDRNLLVVGINGRGTTTDRIQHANFVYLLPPVGPVRMGHALKALFEARTEMMAADNLPTSHTASSELRDPVHESYFTADSKNSASTSPNMSSVNPIVHSLIPQNGELESSKEAILLVDDNEINLRILIACISRLKQQNIGYLTATNGQDALEKYIAASEAGTRIALIFMDISMPVMDGFASTREIRAFEKKSGMKRRLRSRIVALTGLASAQAQHEIESCGFDLYLRKPVNLKTVREILSNEKISSE